MTFEAFETSLQDGAPIELWVFSVYGVNYRYTTASEDYVFFGSTYLSRALSHSDFEQSAEIPKNNITLQVPRDFEILQFFESMPPSDVILLQIFQTHRGDDDAVPGWTGRVMNASRKGLVAELYCENVYTSLKRIGLRRHYSTTCGHTVYDPTPLSCQAPEANFEFNAILDSVAGIELQSTAFANYDDGRLAGGLLEYEPTPGRIERRGIKAHVGNAIQITHPVDGMPTLATVRVLPGCKHTVDDCDDFFDNIKNFGGTPFVPQKNPMGNTSVF